MDAGIQKKIHGSETTILMISNEEMYDIMFLDSTKLKIVWTKITFFKRRVSIIL